MKIFSVLNVAARAAARTVVPAVASAAYATGQRIDRAIATHDQKRARQEAFGEAVTYVQPNQPPAGSLEARFKDEFQIFQGRNTGHWRCNRRQLIPKEVWDLGWQAVEKSGPLFSKDALAQLPLLDAQFYYAEKTILDHHQSRINERFLERVSELEKDILALKETAAPVELDRDATRARFGQIVKAGHRAKVQISSQVWKIVSPAIDRMGAALRDLAIEYAESDARECEKFGLPLRYRAITLSLAYAAIEGYRSDYDSYFEGSESLPASSPFFGRVLWNRKPTAHELARAKAEAERKLKEEQEKADLEARRERLAKRESHISDAGKAAAIEDANKVNDQYRELAHQQLSRQPSV